ncbi:unnamed protein product [Heterobilharzia americana]|nr:unnamed protein product [Heterobilharzia americana]
MENILRSQNVHKNTFIRHQNSFSDINSIRLLCKWMMTVDTRNYELLKDSYEVFPVDKLKAVKLLDQNVTETVYDTELLL